MFTAKEEAGETCPELEAPDHEGAEYLIQYLFQVGPGSDGSPISFCEIRAWMSLTGVVLTAWEATALRSLSAAYMGEHFAAADPNRPPPYAAPTPLDRKAVSDKLLAAFAQLQQQDASREA